MKIFYTFIIGITFVTGLIFPITVSAVITTTGAPQQDYTLLEPIPCIRGGGESCPNGVVSTIKIDKYISYVFKIGIALAVFLAVIQITYAGFRYMMSEVITDKGAAKKTISNAIWGLLGALGSYLILYTINPDLVQFSGSVPALNLKADPRVLNQQTLSQQLERTNAENKEVLNFLKNTENENAARVIKIEQLNADIQNGDLIGEELEAKQAEIRTLEDAQKNATVAAEKLWIKTTANSLYQRAVGELKAIPLEINTKGEIDALGPTLDIIKLSKEDATNQKYDETIQKLEAVGATAEAAQLKQEKLYYQWSYYDEKLTQAYLKYNEWARSVGNTPGGENRQIRAKLDDGLAYKQSLEAQLKTDPDFSKRTGITDPELQKKFVEESQKRIDLLKSIPPKKK